MPVSLRKARDYMFTTGSLLERALFSYLLDNGPLEHLHTCLWAYKNPDGGWGHGLEHWHPRVTIDVLMALKRFGQL